MKTKPNLIAILGPYAVVLGGCLLGLATSPSARAGRVIAWGANESGQATVPPGLTDVVAVAAGGAGLALTAQGRVVAWGGSSFYGQAAVPTGLSNVVAIAAGSVHSLALTSDGRVVAWGGGSPSFSNSYYPGLLSAPSDLTNAVAIAAGSFHNLALTADGRVVTWGHGENVPPVPTGLRNVVGVAAGSGVSYALTSEGRVIGWGRFSSGDYYELQRSMSHFRDVVALSAVDASALALTSDGRVLEFAWPGDPQQVMPHPITNAVAVADGGSYKLGLMADGTVATWGHHWSLGEAAAIVPPGLTNVVGIPTTGALLAIVGNPPGTAPPRIVALPNAIAIAGSPFHHRIQAQNWADGFEAQGLPDGLSLDPVHGLITGSPTGPGTYRVGLVASNVVGTGTFALKIHVLPPATPLIAPSQVFTFRLGEPGEATVDTHYGASSFQDEGLPAGLTMDPATGRIHGIPIQDGDFNVTVCASNQNGTGCGSVRIRVPAVVTWPQDLLCCDPGHLQFTNIVALSGGEFSLLGLTADGRVTAWGGDDFNNYDGHMDVPADLTNAVAIAAGFHHSLALTEDGRIVAWDDATVPDGLTNVVAISAGEYNNLALTADGRVVAWGKRYDVGALTEVPLAAQRNVVAIAAGGMHCISGHHIALTADGRVIAWGSNHMGSYGGATCPEVPIPTFQSIVPAGLGKVTDVAAGGYFSLALAEDGAAGAWGGGIALSADWSDVIAMSGAVRHAVALTGSGRVVVWEDSPEVGISAAPNPLNNVVAVAAGGGGGSGDLRDFGAALVGLPPGLAPPQLIGPHALLATTDWAFHHRIIAKNGVNLFEAAGLPPGLELDAVRGVISGVPEDSGRFEVILTASNSLGANTRRITIYVNDPVPYVEGDSPLVIMAGSVRLRAPGYFGTSYAASGLPPGLSLNPLTGTIEGETEQEGVFTVSLTVSSRFGTATGSFALHVVSVSGISRSGLANPVLKSPIGPLEATLLGPPGFYLIERATAHDLGSWSLPRLVHHSEPATMVELGYHSTAYSFGMFYRAVYRGTQATPILP